MLSRFSICQVFNNIYIFLCFTFARKCLFNRQNDDEGFNNHLSWESFKPLKHIHKNMLHTSKMFKRHKES